MLGNVLKFGRLAAIGALMVGGTGVAEASTIYLGEGPSAGTILQSGASPQTYHHGATILTGSSTSTPVPELSTGFDYATFSIGASDVYYWVSETGVTTSSPLGLHVSLGDAELALGMTLVVTAYEDNSDTPFGTANELFTHTFTSTTLSDVSAASLEDVTSPYSLTVEYELEKSRLAIGGLAASGSITAPELSTWAMLILGFVGLGYAGFRRSAKGRLASL